MPTTAAPTVLLAHTVTGAGPPLLLLHGGLVSQAAWQPQVVHFASRCRMFTCDLRGHGASPRSTDPYSVALFAADVVALLDALGVERAVCCGHSLGGMVAQELAIAYPQRVRALILADTSYGTSTTPLEALGSRLARWSFALLSVAYLARLTAQVHGRRRPAVGPYLEQELRQHAAAKANYLNIWDAVFAFDSRARLASIACPTLILAGADNRQVHAQARRMQQTIPGAALTLLPNAGHMLHWDNTAGFNLIVERFLATLPAE